MNKTPEPNVQIRAIVDPNPWDTPDTLPKFHPVGATLLSLFLVAATLYHPALTPHSAYTVVLLGACILVLAAIVRSLMVGIVSTVLFAGGYLLGMLLGADPLTVATPVLASIVAIGIGAFLLTACRSKALYLIPFVVYGAALLISRDYLTAALTLVPFPAMGILAYCIMQNRPRVWSICLTSFMYGLCLVFVLALSYYRTAGSITFAELFRALELSREPAIEALLSYEPYTAAMATLYKDVDVPIRTIATTQLEFVFNILPALIIGACNLLAYTAQLMCVQTYASAGMAELMTKASQLFVHSILSAIIYVVCFVVAIFPSEMTMFGAVVYNLLLILLPGMALIGVYKLVGDIRRGMSKIWLFILIGCAIFQPMMLGFCISFSGALTTLTRPLIARMLLKQGHPPSDFDGSDKH